ncbi:hypothetical protein GQX74_007277 [Glossina fuscipes]|nr:hypothetical protein GQX74_007277 [Glossina fuscipes]
MNCVAIPHTEDKRAAASTPPLHILHSEVTLTTPIIENTSSNCAGSGGGGGGGSNIGNHNNNNNNNNNATNAAAIGINKSQSLQRTTTTHLYCRSLDKDVAALAVPQRRSTTSRSFASCLRGERDDAYVDYQKRALQYETARQQQQQQRHQQQQLLDDNHPVQVLQSSINSACSNVGETTITPRNCTSFLNSSSSSSSNDEDILIFMRLKQKSMSGTSFEEEN